MKALAIAASCCAVAAPANVPIPEGPLIVLSAPLPSLVRIGQQVTVKGKVAGALAHASSALQLLPEGPGGRWTTIARAPLTAHHRFTIRWHVAQAKFPLVSLRVVELSRDRVIARTQAKQSAVGPAPVYCAAPVPPAVDIPVGDGWIVGGLYLAGGPFPGIFECEQQAYTIRALTSTGTVAASMQVAGGHSYTLVVPAGSYTLRASTCGFGSATVEATKGTTANAVCPVP